MQNHPENREPQWTIRKVLNWTVSYFNSRDIENPKSDAAILLAHVLNLRRIDLFIQYDKPLNSDELAAFRSLIKRRVSREPIAYIVGKKGFWTLDLLVSEDVLIPRPETECLVEAALSVLPESSSPKRILELGTGTGAVILSLARERPGNLFFASDRSVRAIKMARGNAKNYGLDKSVSFFCGDWLSALNNVRQFDIIVSNPPYIRTGDIERLQPEINKYEPYMALDGGENGLNSIEHIVRRAHAYLADHGNLLLEMGHDQKNDVMEIIDKCACYDNVAVTKDYSGYDRVIRTRKKD
ncbi:MAG: peptide chain release factor N(5)-glutamine methyltransferase [Desulfobacterales bacterium]|nr:peptide chain release factor N(5)-glutamine methyltransferase [Desulfobacterales bacterium]